MRGKIAIAGLVLLCLFSMGACKSEGPVVPDEKTPSLSETFESVEGQQVKMTAGGVEVFIVLNDSRAAASFVEMLPLELELIERYGFAKGMALPYALSTDEATTREYKIGDFGYWADGPDLAIFYDDFYDQTIVPIIPIGRAITSTEGIRHVFGTVKFERVQEPVEGIQSE